MAAEAGRKAGTAGERVGVDVRQGVGEMDGEDKGRADAVEPEEGASKGVEGDPDVRRQQGKAGYVGKSAQAGVLEAQVVGKAAIDAAKPKA